jgi:hypothetical protein
VIDPSGQVVFADFQLDADRFLAALVASRLARMSSTITPSQAVLSFDHAVTQ